MTSSIEDIVDRAEMYADTAIAQGAEGNDIVSSAASICSSMTLDTADICERLDKLIELQEAASQNTAVVLSNISQMLLDIRSKS